MAGVLCHTRSLAQEEGCLQLRKSGLSTHAPQMALEKDIPFLLSLCKHANPSLPLLLFAWFVEIANGSGQGCLLLDVHRAQRCSDLEQGSINLMDYSRKCHSDEKPYRNRKKRKGPIWGEKNDTATLLPG